MSVVSLRVSDEETCVTFQSAKSAIDAVSFNGQEVKQLSCDGTCTYVLRRSMV